MLSTEQQLVYNKFKQGNNIMITGSAGSGKSYIIKEIVNYCTNVMKLRPSEIAVTAMTGCAAVLLDCGAQTLHSWSGIGLGTRQFYKILNRILGKKLYKNRWEDIKMLIVDEISMMSQRIFDLLDFIGKGVKKNNKPFGGIQLLFSGDFFQLPPIGNNNIIHSSNFCFESKLWNDTFSLQILFDKNFRQYNDTKYKNILEEIKMNKLSKKSYLEIKERIGKSPENGDYPVMLCPRKKTVETINDNKLNMITNKLYTYSANIIYEKKDSEEDDIDMNDIFKNAMFNKHLQLRKGCQVMCIANIDVELGLCNGTTGNVVGFDYDNAPIVRFCNGRQITMEKYTWKSDLVRGLSVEQYPLILAWAMTIHKCQGVTLNQAIIDAGNDIFADGQVYVALSRVKSLNGLFLTSFKCSKIITNQKVHNFCMNLKSKI